MRKLVVLMLLAVSSVGYAHGPMQHVCIAPERPEDDQNDVQWQQFMSDIDAFRDCVNSKMEWHQQAADGHHQSAQEVVTLWNTFVQTSLNAPEDFPWPEE